MIPSNLRYHQEHEWARVEGKQATIGISHFAQDALGDIVFVDLPKAGAAVKAGDQIGEVESTKTTSTIYTPVSGTIPALTNPGGLLLWKATNLDAGNTNTLKFEIHLVCRGP